MQSSKKRLVNIKSQHFNLSKIKFRERKMTVRSWNNTVVKSYLMQSGIIILFDSRTL